MIKTFPDAVKTLSHYIPLPGVNVQGGGGLERMYRLMRELGNPQDTYPIIHVGGTSGKGSTATMIAALLQTNYPMVGLHTSPNLLSVRERMLINGEQITEGEFVSLAQTVLAAVQRMESAAGIPTYFELLTAMTLLYFSHKQVSVAVIEVGLGGRLDATNVVRSQVAVLTSVGLDHTEILGDTVEKIAQDKVGIIKPGSCVVTGVTQPTVRQIVAAASKQAQVPVSFLDTDVHITLERSDQSGSIFSYQGTVQYSHLTLAALGLYQITNAAVALRTVERFQQVKKRPLLTQAAVASVLSGLIVPGRLEIVAQEPLVILDGAHNPDKVTALVASMRHLFPHKRVLMVVAIKRGKELSPMMESLLVLPQEVFVTNFDLTTEAGATVSYTPQELQQAVHEYDPNLPVFIHNTPQSALAAARKHAGPDDIILITGSLYLVGEVKKHL